MLGGIVCGTEAYIEEVRQKMMLWGQAPDPFARWLLERGLKTLDVRVRRHNENAIAVARVVRRAQGNQARPLSGSPVAPRPRGRAHTS